MAIYRGPGGAGDATNDATSQAILAAQSAQEAAASEAAAATSASNASTSATNAASSATAAANSATSAANSASTATTQAANAASSAATATTKASEASTSATNAASSASAAATSATNAASSATAAANSATSASNSASAASTSASNAATYASNAATSATNAAASETNAASSANSASNSATSAAASATSAGNSASSATTSATNAASSASAAATSASNAATSATSASNSATSAGTSATNAANSASSASTSATNAASSASGAASSASSAAASAAAAAASLDSFDDRYLGSKTADPTLDNDGNALVTGALYYNSVEGEMRVYDGFQWIAASAASQAILVVYKYTATAGQTTFTGTDDNSLTLAYTVGSIIVTVNGVVQEVGTDVTASTGTSIVLAVAASAGDEVNIHAFSTFDVANTYTKAEADAKYLTITSPTIPSGTANGVAYLNGSKVLTTGSALTFDGSTFKNTAGGMSIQGNSTPSSGAGLEILYAGGTSLLQSYDRTGAAYRPIQMVGAGLDFTATSTNPLTFGTGGSEQMRLTSTGLGIGTSSPGKLLDVMSSSNPEARVRSNGGTSGNYAGLILQTYNNFSGSGQAYVRGVSSASGNSNTDLVFGTESSGFGGPVERMRIDSSGSVGIGTSSPSVKLDVSGVVNCSGIQSATSALTFTGQGKWMAQYEGSSISRMYFCGEGSTYGAMQIYSAQSTGSPSATATFNQYGMGVGSAIPSSGTGIAFPATQSASSDPNTLDDYEEGTWTPTLSFSGGTGTITYAQRNGGYTKIGNTVHYYAVVSVTSIGTSSGNASFNNLPFAAVSGYKEEVQPFMAYSLNSNVYAVTSYTQGVTLILCKQTGATSTTINTMASGDFTNGTTLHCSGTFTVA